MAAPSILVRRMIPRVPRPWLIQRLLVRGISSVRYTLLVCGRQVGKTEGGAWALLRAAYRDPGGESCLLVPTYRIGLVAERRLRQHAGPGARWSSARGCLTLQNGHLVHVRSAAHPDDVRSLTITSLMWVEEAALVNQDAWTAALGCLVTCPDARVLATTTPKGRHGWVYNLWTDRERSDVVRLRVRSGQSPFATPVTIADLRRSMGGARAAQELDAQFVDDSSQPFKPDDVQRLFGAIKRRGKRWSIGLDLGKQKDYTCLVAMNEFGEAWVIGHWRHVDWPDTQARVVKAANDLDGSVIVIDIGHGGGYGGALFDYLEREVGKARLLPVRTGNRGVKAEVVEALIADVEHGRLTVDEAGAHAEQLRHELLFFESLSKVVGGAEIVTYNAPPGDDEHDDCVIALALANHGRLHAWERDDPLEGDFSGFAGGGGPGASRASQGLGGFGTTVGGYAS